MKSVEHSSKKRFLVKAKCGSKLDRKKKKKGVTIKRDIEKRRRFVCFSNSLQSRDRSISRSDEREDSEIFKGGGRSTCHHSYPISVRLQRARSDESSRSRILQHGLS